MQCLFLRYRATAAVSAYAANADELSRIAIDGSPPAPKRYRGEPRLEPAAQP
jgi:hypothetical protein